MNVLHKTPWGARALAGLLALAATAAVHAQATYNVSLDTSSLSSSFTGPFSLDFQFNSGSGLNWATLSNFQFGGGVAIGSAETLGDATGSLGSTITLGASLSEPFSSFYQEFTPGTSFSFDVSVTTNTPWSGLTDQFTFVLWPVSTEAPNGLSLVEISLGDSGLTTATFGNADQGLAAPSITAIPEPSTYGLWLGAFLMAAVVTRRVNAKRRSMAPAASE
ncbi:MAG TPA: NF038129 family PEP-CTERM protein [Opitutaceae bacterium]|nr:NF038129 family PEP-CTERM protein [Opitutaceae bacterium]